MATQEQELGGWGRLVEAGRRSIQPRISQIKLHRRFLERGGTGELDSFTEHLHDKSGGFSVHDYSVVSVLVNDLLEECGKERQVPELQMPGGSGDGQVIPLDPGRKPGGGEATVRYRFLDVVGL